MICKLLFLHKKNLSTFAVCPCIDSLLASYVTFFPFAIEFCHALVPGIKKRRSCASVKGWSLKGKVGFQGDATLETRVKIAHFTKRSCTETLRKRSPARNLADSCKADRSSLEIIEHIAVSCLFICCFTFGFGAFIYSFRFILCVHLENIPIQMSWKGS